MRTRSDTGRGGTALGRDASLYTTHASGHDPRPPGYRGDGTKDPKSRARTDHTTLFQTINTSVVLYLKLDDRLGLGGGWEDGPAPFEYRGRRTDEATRREYFSTRIGDVLLGSGSPEAGGARRLHRHLDPTPVLDKHVVLEDLEALELQSRSALPRSATSADVALVAHGRLTDAAAGAPLTILNRLVTTAGRGGAAAPEGDDEAAWWRTIVPEGARLLGRPFVVTYAEPSTSPLCALHPADSPYAIDEQWMLHLAACVTPDSWTPHRDAAKERPIRLSASWSATVLRDGACFLAHRRAVDDDFLIDAPNLARSVYVDTLLLGRLQHDAIEAFGDEIAALGDPKASHTSFHDLERRVTAFRTQFWWKRVAPTGHANLLLADFQSQHELEERAEQVFAEMRDYGEQIQTAAADQAQQFQRVVTLFAAIVVVPAAVAGLFGANVRFPGYDTEEGFIALLLFMAAAGIGSYALLREMESPRRRTADQVTRKYSWRFIAQLLLVAALAVVGALLVVCT